MNKLALAAAVIVALTTASSIAQAGGCDDWGCGMNGIQLTGIALPGADSKGIAVEAVTLPSGETVTRR